jgi:hypothetical protein
MSNIAEEVNSSNGVKELDSARRIEILDRQIQDLNVKISNFIKHGISNRKIQKMELLKSLAIDAKNAIQNQ